MKLTITDTGVFFDEEDDFTPEGLLTLLEGTKLWQCPARARYTGVCDECNGLAQYAGLLGFRASAAALLATCESVKPSGFEDLGILKVDWIIPRGPYIKKAVVQMFEDIFLSKYESLDALITLLDNISSHGPSRDLNRRHFGGTVVKTDEFLSLYEVTIRIA